MIDKLVALCVAAIGFELGASLSVKNPRSKWSERDSNPEPLDCEPGGGGGYFQKKFGMGVRPTSQTPYPIYDQNLRFSRPYL